MAAGERRLAGGRDFQDDRDDDAERYAIARIHAALMPDILARAAGRRRRTFAAAEQKMSTLMPATAFLYHFRFYDTLARGKVDAPERAS